MPKLRAAYALYANSAPMCLDLTPYSTSVTFAPRRVAVVGLRIGRSSMVNQSRTKNSRAPYCIYALSSPIFTCCLSRFLQHPWSSLTSMFLNFKGAGPGRYVPQLLTIYSNFNRRS